jgi:hypothetical protein
MDGVPYCHCCHQSCDESEFRIRDVFTGTDGGQGEKEKKMEKRSNYNLCVNRFRLIFHLFIPYNLCVADGCWAQIRRSQSQKNTLHMPKLGALDYLAMTALSSVAGWTYRYACTKGERSAMLSTALFTTV